MCMRRSFYIRDSWYVVTYYWEIESLDFSLCKFFEIACTPHPSIF